jgi:hypothetical protein
MWYQELLADPFLRVLLLVLAAAVGWVILRLIFKIAMRVFVIGCLAFFILGAVLFILNLVAR